MLKGLRHPSKSLINSNQHIHMNRIKSTINKAVNYMDNTFITLPTLQDINNIREFIPVAIRNYRINQLNKTIDRLANRKDKLVSKNIAKFMQDFPSKDLETTY